METLRTRSEFKRVQGGRKWVTPAFILFGSARGDEAGARFGFTVSSRSVAKVEGGVSKRGLAVDRNRVRRRLKEAVRLTESAHARADFDYVIIGRAAALTRNFEDLLADLRFAFHKLHNARQDQDRYPSP